MTSSTDITKLCSTPDFHRNEEWAGQFLTALAQTRLELTAPEPQRGPDGWPYMMVKTGHQGTEPLPRLAEWVREKGIGLAVNTHKELPDYILTYGMLWLFCERGVFLEPTQTVPPGSTNTFHEGAAVYVGPPSESYLPLYVRHILSEFFLQQGIKEPRLIMLSRDQKHWDLCFSLESLGSPPEKEHRGILEALSWFLPNHYSLMLISEKGLPEFYPLKRVADSGQEA